MQPFLPVACPWPARGLPEARPWPARGQAFCGMSLSPHLLCRLLCPVTRRHYRLSVPVLNLWHYETPRAHLLFFLLSPSNRATFQELPFPVPGKRYLGAKIWAPSVLLGCGCF